LSQILWALFSDFRLKDTSGTEHSSLFIVSANDKEKRFISLAQEGQVTTSQGFYTRNLQP